MPIRSPNFVTPFPISHLPIWVNALPCRVAAGFPSPAEDHAIKRVDLMEQLIKHPQATFLLRVRGESMRDAGIFDNDVVLVDRAIRPHSGHVVVAVVDGVRLQNPVATGRPREAQGCQPDLYRTPHWEKV